MRREDIEAGDYIHYDYQKGTVILISENDGRGCTRSHNIKQRDKTFEHSSFTLNGGDLRYATKQEIKHLDDCIKANKYVEPTEEVYEIY